MPRSSLFLQHFFCSLSFLILLGVSGAQSGIQMSETLASPGNLLEMQIFRLYPHLLSNNNSNKNNNNKPSGEWA